MNRQEVKSSITQNTIIIEKFGDWSVKSIFLISSFLLALHLSSARKTDVLWQGADMKYIPNKSTLVLIPYGYISIHWACQPLADICEVWTVLDVLVVYGSLLYQEELDLIPLL